MDAFQHLEQNDFSMREKTRIITFRDEDVSEDKLEFYMKYNCKYVCVALDRDDEGEHLKGIIILRNPRIIKNVKKEIQTKRINIVNWTEQGNGKQEKTRDLVTNFKNSVECYIEAGTGPKFTEQPTSTEISEIAKRNEKRVILIMRKNLKE